MGVNLLVGRGQGMLAERIACLYCSTTDWAFGPVFQERDGYEAEVVADAFLEWLPGDPRVLPQADLERKYGEFLRTAWPLWVKQAREDEENFRHLHSAQTESGL